MRPIATVMTRLGSSARRATIGGAGETNSYSYDKTGFLSKERFDSLLQPLVGHAGETNSYSYDKTGFLSKERFDSLLQPLVGQVRPIATVMTRLGSSARPLVGQVRPIATVMTRLGSSARRGLTPSYNHWWGR